MQLIITGTRALANCDPFFEAGSEALAECAREDATTIQQVAERIQYKRIDSANREVFAVLDALRDEAIKTGDPITHIFQGGAKGPDTAALAWAQLNHITCVTYKPNWQKHGKAAGFKRNWWMLFNVAGRQVAAAHDFTTGVRAKALKALEVEIEQRRKSHDWNGDWRQLIHDREVFADPRHPEYREQLIRYGALLPGAKVIAFWDRNSQGTRHCINAARLLGYEVIVHCYKPHKAKAQPGDLGKIDHRRDNLQQPMFTLGGPEL